MTRIESRATWGARPGRGSSYLGSTRGVKGHYTGGYVNPATLTDHEKCRAAVRGIQNGHMDSNGWNDIGYSMIVCNHDVAMIGRGAHVLPAANGPGLNSGHYAILVLVGNTGVTQMTDNMRRAFHGARDFLRANGNAGAEIKGHRDGYSTDCPGPSVYAWITGGAKLPSGSTPDPAPHDEPKEKDMDYGSFGLSSSSARDLPGNTWVSVPMDTEYADPYGDHSGTGESILLGEPSQYGLSAVVELSGVPVGTPVSLRCAEFQYDSTATPPVDRLKEEGWETTQLLPESGRVGFSDVGHVQEGRKLRVQVKVHASGTGYKISGARLKYLAQR
ncbi:MULTISPECIES: peptidoglycan recognition family protein [unclassified Nonomuraea]|uniref:peptidoglycan recognition protein family protein n=1 Tax=unclassified Nonomuraea TaxID=2593643 RepID=UPI0033F93D52